jgi:hypothetical protein
MVRKRRPLTIRQILAWADENHARTGQWPRQCSGPVAAAPEESWSAIHTALYQGKRGLAGEDTLARLLARDRGATDARLRPPLTAGKILAWANAHQRKTGEWPGVLSGPIPGSAGENWRAVTMALL